MYGADLVHRAFMLNMYVHVQGLQACSVDGRPDVRHWPWFTAVITIQGCVHHNDGDKKPVAMHCPAFAPHLHARHCAQINLASASRCSESFRLRRVELASAPAAATPVAVSTDEHFMALALVQAEKAFAQGEVPIGAVLVINSEVVAAAYNLTETRQNPLCHAEMLCISAAAEQQLAWRLHEATLYSTVEPCPMCAGAILQARLARLVYGARQPRIGADGSWVALFPQQERTQLHQPTCLHDLNEKFEVQDLHDSSAEAFKQQQSSHCNQPLAQFLAPQLPPAGAAVQHAARQPAACDTTQNLPQQQHPLQPVGPHPFHPNMEVTEGVLAAASARLMQSFFKQRRSQQKAAAAAAAASTVAVPLSAAAAGAESMPAASV